MFLLDSFNGLENLPDLIGLGFATLVLDIYARIARPWCFVDAVARAALPRFAKVCLTYSAEVPEPNITGVPAHPLQELRDARHINAMIPIMVL
jgi:hypothetical protein